MWSLEFIILRISPARIVYSKLLLHKYANNNQSLWNVDIIVFLKLGKILWKRCKNQILIYSKIKFSSVILLQIAQVFLFVEKNKVRIENLVYTFSVYFIFHSCSVTNICTWIKRTVDSYWFCSLSNGNVKVIKSVYIASRTYRLCWQYAIMLAWKTWSSVKSVKLSS